MNTDDDCDIELVLEEISIFLLMVDSLVRDKEYELAILNLKYSLKKYPKHLGLTNLMGFVCTRLEKFEDALEFLTFVESELLDNYDAEVNYSEKLENLFYLSQYYIQLNSTQNSLNYLNLLLIEFPEEINYCVATSYFERGKLYKNELLIDLAKLDFKKSLKILDSLKQNDDHFEDYSNIEQSITEILS